MTFDIHDGIAKANAARDGERIRHQEAVITSCTTLKFYIRLTHEVLKPECSILYWDGMVDSIESQMRKWLASTGKRVAR